MSLQNAQKTMIQKFDIPSSFEVRGKALRHKMQLVEEQKTFGYLKSSKSEGLVTFHLYDTFKNEVAFACKNSFNYGSLIEVYDMFGGLMGSIEHTIQNPMFSPIEKYVMFDGFGKIMAESKQQDEINKFISLFDSDGKRGMTMRKSMNKIKNNWTINIGQQIDKRVGVFLPIFASSESLKDMI